MERVFLRCTVSRTTERRETLWLTKPHADLLKGLGVRSGVWQAAPAGTSCLSHCDYNQTQMFISSILRMMKTFLPPGICSVGTHNKSHNHTLSPVSYWSSMSEWRLYPSEAECEKLLPDQVKQLHWPGEALLPN